MKIDRYVNRLNKRIEEKFPLEILQEEEQEGTNCWKGKRILPVDLWEKMIMSLENDQVVINLSKGFKYFPDSISEVIFQYNVEGTNEYLEDIHKEEFNKWLGDYLSLLAFKRNPELGRSLCRNCLLDPFKDRSGFLIGIHKIVANVLQNELETKHSNFYNTENNQLLDRSCDKFPIYPCNILNYFSCPFEGKNETKKFKNEFSSDLDHLFELEKITNLVDNALLKASSLTKSNESIYDVNLESNTVKEVQTLQNGKQYVMMTWSPIEKGKNQILGQSVIPVRNKEDILEILKDSKKLDAILEQGLSKELYEKWKNKILNFFEQVTNQLSMNFDFKYNVYENKQLHYCFVCNKPTNIHIINQVEKWLCLEHWNN